MEIHYPLATMMPKKFFVRWVWSINGYMHPNDCILYRKEFEGLKKCPKCGLSRYKEKINNEEKGELEKDGPALKVV